MDMKHYIKKCAEHEARRASWNERHAYWKEYLLRCGPVDTVPIDRFALR
jgi:hypothetical protein